MGQGAVQARAGSYLVDPNVDTNTTARSMLDNALARWFKELSGGSGNGKTYIRWQHHQVSGNRFMEQPAWGDHKNQPEGDKLEKIKSIEWAPIEDSAQRLTNSGKFVGEAIHQAIGGIAAQVGDAWTDKNGQTAVEKIKAVDTAGLKFVDTANRFATNMMGFVVESKKAIQKVVDFAGNGTNNYFNYLGNDDEVDLADFNDFIDYIDKCLRTGRTDCGNKEYNLAKARSTEPGLVIDCGDWGGHEYSDVAKGRLDRFCSDYSNNVRTMRRLITEAHDAIDWHLNNLLQASGGFVFQPYKDLDSLASQPKNPGQDQPKNPGQDQPKNPGQDHPKNPGQDQPKNPGQDHPGNTGGGDQPRNPPGPPPPNADYKPPATDPSLTPQPVPGSTDPSTHQPDPNDPGTQDPTQQPGQGPVNGPVTEPGSSPNNETVTIQDGDHKISVTSPDSSGHVKVTVDDGTGQPKTYDLDFGQGTGTDPKTNMPGGQYDPSQPNHFGPDGSQGPGQTPGQPGQGQFGPDGQAHTLPAPADGVIGGQETLKPGPDGKIVLQDGNVTITAEHPPGQPDQVKLTVDDGSGKPTTYLLDYGDPANPQVQNAADQAQGFAGTGRETAGPQGFAAAGEARHSLADSGGFGGGGGGGFDTAAASAAPAASAAEPLQSVPGSDQPVQATHTQAIASDFGASSGGTNGFADSAWSTQGDLLSGGDQVAPSAGEAGLASVGDDRGQHHAPSPAGQSSAAMGGGGMPMMGMGAGGAGGGDTERSGSGGQWSVQGDLFADDTAAEAANIAGVLDNDGR